MKSISALGCIGIACIANAIQLPGYWDIWDIAAIIMAGLGMTLAYAGLYDAMDNR